MFKTIVLLILLFAVSVLLITPLMLSNRIKELIQNSDIGDNWIKKETIITYSSTYCVLFVNVVIIPFLIDMMVLIEDFRTKSERQTAILNRNFVFMLLNSVLLPLTDQVTIKLFIERLN